VRQISVRQPPPKRPSSHDRAGGSCGKPEVPRFLRELPPCYRVVPRHARCAVVFAAPVLLAAPLSHCAVLLAARIPFTAPLSPSLRLSAPLRRIDRPGQLVLVPLSFPTSTVPNLECGSRCCRSSPLAFNRALTREGGSWRIGPRHHMMTASRGKHRQGRGDVAATGESRRKVRGESMGRITLPHDGILATASLHSPKV